MTKLRSKLDLALDGPARPRVSGGVSASDTADALERSAKRLGAALSPFDALRPRGADGRAPLPRHFTRSLNRNFNLSGNAPGAESACAWARSADPNYPDGIVLTAWCGPITGPVEEEMFFATTTPFGDVIVPPTSTTTAWGAPRGLPPGVSFNRWTIDPGVVAIPTSPGRFAVVAQFGASDGDHAGIAATNDGGVTWDAHVLDDPATQGLDYERAVVDPVDGTIWTIWAHVEADGKHPFLRWVQYNPCTPGHICDPGSVFTFGPIFELVSPNDAKGNRVSKHAVALAVSRETSGATRLHAVWEDQGGDPKECYPLTKTLDYWYSTIVFGGSFPPLWLHKRIATDTYWKCASPQAANSTKGKGNPAYMVNPRPSYVLSPKTGRHLVAVVSGTAEGTNVIRLFQSTDPLNQWSHQDLASPSLILVNLWRPGIALYPWPYSGTHSRVGVKWLETRTDVFGDGLTRVMFATSVDDGQTFDTPTELSVSNETDPDSGGTIPFRFRYTPDHAASTRDYDDMTAIEPTDSFPDGGFFVTWPDQRRFETDPPYQELWAASIA